MCACWVCRGNSSLLEVKAGHLPWLGIVMCQRGTGESLEELMSAEGFSGSGTRGWCQPHNRPRQPGPALREDTGRQWAWGHQEGHNMAPQQRWAQPCTNPSSNGLFWSSHVAGHCAQLTKSLSPQGLHSSTFSKGAKIADDDVSPALTSKLTFPHRQ